MKVPYSENIIEIKVLGSRFIGILCPLDSEDEVNPLLAKYRELYPKATHYCSASRFGPLSSLPPTSPPTPPIPCASRRRLS
ncbi:MAG: YigZ family protein [Kiritimatiellae bacterium]|nr:YigZ family protein [Kiritimatiellia bacterium]